MMTGGCASNMGAETDQATSVVTRCERVVPLTQHYSPVSILLGVVFGSRIFRTAKVFNGG